jgi:hypothetical protein
MKPGKTTLRHPEFRGRRLWIIQLQANLSYQGTPTGLSYRLGPLESASAPIPPLTAFFSLTRQRFCALRS